MNDGLATKGMNKSKGMIAKIVGIMFMSRTATHMAHLKTGSYAKHKALQKFYEDIVDLADDLSEATQGMYGKMDIPYEAMDGDVSDPIGMLTKHVARINAIAEKCDEPFIGNIIQEVQKLYYGTLYKLKELN